MHLRPELQPLLLAGAIVVSCARPVDPGVAIPPITVAPGYVTDSGTVGVVAPTCEESTNDALRILKTNCAVCHEYPNAQASFSFVLDVDQLIATRSSTGKHFVEPGSPEQSRIYERIARGEMPPPIIPQRPGQDDLSRLGQWITYCAKPGKGFGQRDGGTPDAMMVDPASEPCASNNTCANGGCCVSGYCRANGRSCTTSGGDDIPGTCTNGSCVAPGTPPCGNLNQACCGAIHICTAPATVCPAGGSTCQPCGRMGGRCCQVGGQANCDPGLGCVVMATGDPGTCKPCGLRGQDCCGLGSRRTCNAGLTCQFVGGAKFTCDAPGGQQPPPPDGGRSPTPPDSGRPQVRG